MSTLAIDISILVISMIVRFILLADVPFSLLTNFPILGFFALSMLFYLFRLLKSFFIPLKASHFQILRFAWIGEEENQRPDASQIKLNSFVLMIVSAISFGLLTTYWDHKIGTNFSISLLMANVSIVIVYFSILRAFQVYESYLTLFIK